MSRLNLAALLLTAATLLTACGDSSRPAGLVTAPGGPPPVPAVPLSRFDLANGCYTLKSVAANAYAVHGGDGSYSGNPLRQDRAHSDRSADMGSFSTCRICYALETAGSVKGDSPCTNRAALPVLFC